MWQIFGVLLASASTLFLLYASYEFGDSIRQNSQRDYFANEVANPWIMFGKALERYVQDYGSSLPSGDTTVTCTDLKNNGYLQSSFSCTDVLGQELSGLVAKPGGMLQTILVYPATPPSLDMYLKMGVKEKVGQRAFIFKTAEVIKGVSPEYELVAYRSDGTFEELFSSTTDNISEYIDGNGIPASFPSDPKYEYVPVMFVKRAKGSGYWVWNFYDTDTGIVFSNQGFSSVCPIPNGLPKKPPNGNWEFNPLPWGERNYTTYYHTALNGVICIPATQDTVLKNPGASLPALGIPVTQSLLDTYIENKPDAEGDYIRDAWECVGKATFGLTEVQIGNRTYTIFGIKRVCADLYLGSTATTQSCTENTQVSFGQCTGGGSGSFSVNPFYFQNYSPQIKNIKVINAGNTSRIYIFDCFNGAGDWLVDNWDDNIPVSFGSLDVSFSCSWTSLPAWALITKVVGNGNSLDLYFTMCAETDGWGCVSTTTSSYSVPLSGVTVSGVCGPSPYSNIATSGIYFKANPSDPANKLDCYYSYAGNDTRGNPNCKVIPGWVSVVECYTGTLTIGGSGYKCSINNQSYSSKSECYANCYTTSTTGNCSAGGNCSLQGETCADSGCKTFTVDGESVQICESCWSWDKTYMCVVQDTDHDDLPSTLLFIEGKAPSTFCVDFDHNDSYNYCFNIDNLLSGAGENRKTVTFQE